MDIVEAMEIEKEYLALNPQEANEFKFKEKLEAMGYDLEYFNQEKNNYYFNNLKIDLQQSYPLTVTQDIGKSMQTNKEFSLFVIPENNTVCVGTDGYNQEYCEKNNILVLPFGYSGGTVVTTPNDLNFVLALKNPDMILKIQTKIAEILNRFGCPIGDITGNDILINGCKICGGAKKQIGDYSVYFFQISFVINKTLIENICTKKMEKVPKGISEFSNVKREDFIEELREWLK